MYGNTVKINKNKSCRPRCSRSRSRCHTDASHTTLIPYPVQASLALDSPVSSSQWLAPVVSLVSMQRRSCDYHVQFVLSNKLQSQLKVSILSQSPWAMCNCTQSCCYPDGPAAHDRLSMRIRLQHTTSQITEVWPTANNSKKLLFVININ